MMRNTVFICLYIDANILACGKRSYEDENMCTRVRFPWANGETRNFEYDFMLLEAFEEFRARGIDVIHFQVDLMPLNVEYLTVMSYKLNPPLLHN